LLAQDWHELRLHVGKFAFEISFDANPVLGSPARGLILANSRDIIFRMARYNARLAARAAVQIDHHAPLMRHRFLYLS
jgi:hypothetical protein